MTEHAVGTNMTYISSFASLQGAIRNPVLLNGSNATTSTLERRYTLGFYFCERFRILSSSGVLNVLKKEYAVSKMRYLKFKIVNV